MISQSKFENGIALLQAHFNRELSKSAIAIWSEYLNEHLDDEQFTYAVKQAILSLDFFPNAQKLVEFATASNSASAIADWQLIIAAAKSSNEQWQQQILQPLQQRAHLALAAIGGLRVIGMAEDWQLSKLEKQFNTLYCQSPTGLKLLPSAPRNSETIEVVEPNKTDVYVHIETKPPSIRRILEHISKRSQGIEIPIEQLYSNTFARYGWQIDSGRLNYFLSLELPLKQQFMSKFSFAMKNKPGWRSPVSVFDEISGYRPPTPQIDFKSIAREWLAVEEA